MKYGYIVILLLLPITAFALDSELCLKGCPNGSPNTNDELERPIYVLNNNGTTRFADWVAYRVETSNFGPTKTRSFRREPDLDKTKTLKDDYKDAHAQQGYDKGHMAPLASFAGSMHWKKNKLSIQHYATT